MTEEKMIEIAQVSAKLNPPGRRVYFLLREDIPNLLKEIRRLRSEIEMLHKVVDNHLAEMNSINNQGARFGQNVQASSHLPIDRCDSK